MQKNGPQWLIVLMLGIVIVLLTVVLTQRTDLAQVHANGSSLAGDRYAIVTGDIGSGNSCLWLLDSSNNTISAYTCVGGRGLNYVGTRPIQYEVQLTGPMNDLSPNQRSFSNIREAWKKHDDENK